MRLDVVDRHSLLVVAMHGKNIQIRDHSGEAFLAGPKTLSAGCPPDG